LTFNQCSLVPANTTINKLVRVMLAARLKVTTMTHRLFSVQNCSSSITSTALLNVLFTGTRFTNPILCTSKHQWTPQILKQFLQQLAVLLILNTSKDARKVFMQRSFVSVGQQ